MKTAYNKVAVELDLQTAVILQSILWEQENPEDEPNQNFIPKAYRVGVSEEFQDKVGKIDHPNAETF